jgi:chorismate mutase
VSTDPDVERLRERLTANDEAIVSAVNARLELVAELKRVKQERGLDFVDPQREQWLREHLAGSNAGPLSADALDGLVAFLLDLTKREVYREGGA